MGPTRDYLWILAREPELEPAVYRELVKDAERMAFPVNELIRVEQGDACNEWR